MNRRQFMARTAAAAGVWTAGAIRRTPYPEQAYQPGRSL